MVRTHCTSQFVLPTKTSLTRNSEAISRGVRTVTMKFPLDPAYGPKLVPLTVGT
jgi:hypothetical protein